MPPLPLHRKPETLTALAAAILIVSGATASAQHPPPPPDWVDACEVDEAVLHPLLAAECALIRKDAMVQNPDGSYAIIPDAFTYVRGSNPHRDYCQDVPFYGQPRPAGVTPGRSGFLVGPDLVLTAGHTVQPPYPSACMNNWYFVFRQQYTSDGAGGCIPPSFDAIPAMNVFECAEIIRNGLDHDEGDFLLVRLNRPVQRTAPVRIRRSGQADPGDRVVCIGHPDQLATKIDLAGVFDEQTTGSGLPLTLFRNVHLLAGSSGSMFYNIDKQYVESVAVSGVCLLLRQDVPENCWYYDYSCEQIRGIGYAIKSFAHNVPPYYELIVGPLDRVKHIGPAGGPITNAVTQFTISVPTQNAGPMEISVVDPDANLQTLVPVPSISFTIQFPTERKKKVLYPGESAIVTVTCAAGAALPGYHHRRLVVSNGTNGYSDTIWHDFELGLTEFSVKPTQNFHVNAAFPPFTQTMDYFVSNTRPDPVTVRVSRDQPWIRMLPDGPYLGPPFGPETLDFILTPVGTEGDTRVVTVGFNGLADCLPLGQNIANLDFTNISGTGGGDLALGDTMRRVTLNLTRAEFAHGDSVVIPDGDPFGAVAMIDVPAGFTPTDLNVGIGLSQPGHLDEIDPRQLKITVTSPLGETITLWDHESLEYFYSFDDEGVDGQPAPTGQLLSIFDGDNPEGLWTIQVIDDVPGTEHQMSRIILSFDFEREGCE